MILAEALEEYRRHLKSRGSLRRGAAPDAIELLREYLVEFAEVEEASDLTLRDLEQLFARWYPRRDEADAGAAAGLLAAVEEWLVWLDARTGGDLALAFASSAERLSTDLPRILEAQARLSAHARRDDLEGEVSLGGPTLTVLSSGLSHVIRPDEIDYARAEEDRFQVVSLDGDHAALQTPAREALGELPLAPVLLPPGVVDLLRVGDLLHVEVAPGGAGWEVLSVTALYPGGYHGDTR
jgi:hypothetical protein